MMRGLIVMAAASAAFLAACSPQSQDTAAQSPQEAQAEVADAAARLETGLWRTTITIGEMNIPGMPAEAARNLTQGPITVEECRTSDDPRSATEAWAQADGACDAGTFTITGNRFEGARTCSGDGMTMEMRFSGTLTSTRMEGQSQVSTQTPMGAMTQEATVVSERIGDCPG